jgi:hypothetical protein
MNEKENYRIDENIIKCKNNHDFKKI